MASCRSYEKLQKLRCPGHVVYGGGIELIGEVIHAAVEARTRPETPAPKTLQPGGRQREVHRLQIRRLESRIDSMSR